MSLFFQVINRTLERFAPSIYPYLEELEVAYVHYLGWFTGCSP